MHSHVPLIIIFVQQNQTAFYELKFNPMITNYFQPYIREDTITVSKKSADFIENWISFSSAILDISFSSGI